jgi:hypothetical protein
MRLRDQQCSFQHRVLRHRHGTETQLDEADAFESRRDAYVESYHRLYECALSRESHDLPVLGTAHVKHGAIAMALSALRSLLRGNRLESRENPAVGRRRPIERSRRYHLIGEKA